LLLSMHAPAEKVGGSLGEGGRRYGQRGSNSQQDVLPGGGHERPRGWPLGEKFRDRELNPGLLRDRQKY
jgi:hypothetical protein